MCFRFCPSLLVTHLFCLASSCVIQGRCNKYACMSFSGAVANCMSPIIAVVVSFIWGAVFFRDPLTNTTGPSLRCACLCCRLFPRYVVAQPVNRCCGSAAGFEDIPTVATDAVQVEASVPVEVTVRHMLLLRIACLFSILFVCICVITLY